MQVQLALCIFCFVSNLNFSSIYALHFWPTLNSQWSCLSALHFWLVLSALLTRAELFVLMIYVFAWICDYSIHQQKVRARSTMHFVILPCIFLLFYCLTYPVFFWIIICVLTIPQMCHFAAGRAGNNLQCCNVSICAHCFVLLACFEVWNGILSVAVHRKCWQSRLV